eukprot:5844953-Alexandrium_andersonii.AAC.1
MSVPEDGVKVIERLLFQPLFRVRMDRDLSEWKSQGTGVRQGCTLSPLLFLIVMTVITGLTAAE